MSKTRKGIPKFAIAMIVYAVVFLLLAGAGLTFFWDYMEAYESSRPKVAINAYMQSLTEEHICDLSQELIDQVDHNIQTEEQCRAYIMDAIGEISYAKKSKESSDMRQVFVLRTHNKVIGEFSIVARPDGKYGFSPWYFENESFDISTLDLFGEGYQTMVPFDHTVTVNGFALTGDYITEDKIAYEEIEEYYDDFELPYRVVYSVAPIMGQMEAVVTDPSGKAVSFDENTDWTPYFHNCTENEREELETFIAEFLNRYITYTGSRKNSRYVNYYRLIPYVVMESDFGFRLENAIGGLEFGQSTYFEVTSIKTNHQVCLEEGRYLCDISYEVDIGGNDGVVRDYKDAKIIVVRTEEGLKVESVNIY